MLFHCNLQCWAYFGIYTLAANGPCSWKSRKIALDPYGCPIDVGIHDDVAAGDLFFTRQTASTPQWIPTVSLVCSAKQQEKM